jgi:ATP-dependent protease HslVU (ClpYQ) peptidase subunit
LTTIAANAEQMVADSKVTVGQGTSYRAMKIVRVRKMIVGACGHGGDCSRFLDWAQRDFKAPAPKWKCDPDDDESVLALILKSDGLYAYTQTDPEPEKMNEDFFAIGSGGKAARAAMLMGADPVKAVELSCQVDDNSGLPLQILYLDEKKKDATGA